MSLLNVEAAWDSVAYYGDNPHTQRLIAQTITQLPDDVAEFALDRCRFLSVGVDCFAMTVSGRIASHDLERRTRNMWLILLHEKLPVDEELSIIAHEIAHAWLGHDKLSLDFSPTSEVDAATLTATWGFTGRGADPEYCAD